MPSPRERRELEKRASRGDAGADQGDARESGSTANAILPEADDSRYGEKGELRAHEHGRRPGVQPKGPFPREE